MDSKPITFMLEFECNVNVASWYESLKCTREGVVRMASFVLEIGKLIHILRVEWRMLMLG